ncbi:methyl-accepting chemotaxis protein [Gorillibacterium sp. sgz5001074]|uniref:methyl-accepting chemotaxis protein n=1 Tax=Gorillibacterium sp. sgz5001074 TaxID=3446695 RepID=UPI003F679639
MKRKLVGTFLLLSLLVGLTCGIAYEFIARIDRTHSELMDTRVIVTQEAAMLLALSERQSSLLFHYLAEPNAEKEKALKEANGLQGQAVSRLEGLLDESRKDKLRAMGEANVTFLRLIGKVQDYVHGGKPDLARSEALLWSAPLTETMVKHAQELRNEELAAMEADRASNDEEVNGVKKLFVAVAVAAVLIAIASGLLLSRAIVGPLREMVRLAGRIAACDLTGGDIPARSRDEIGQLAEALNGMKRNLRSIIRQLEDSAGLVAASAETLSVSSEQVSRSSETITQMSQTIMLGTETQAANVETSAGALQEMSRMMEAVVRNAQSALAQTGEALAASQEGDEAARTAEEQMNAIYAKMNAIAESVRQLAARAGDILEANGLIGQIARQTNILSINASIEASRAGSEGRGFSVVAAEIRQLAGQTGAAAEEVDRLMERMREEMTRVELSTAAGQAEAAEGIRVVRSAGEALQRIHRSSETSDALVQEAAGRTTEAAALSASALDAVSAIRELAWSAADSAREVSASTQEQYAGMEEITSSAVLLLQMAGELRDTISRFRVEQET